MGGGVAPDDVHDRVWIKDFHSAYVVGTSFNGLGDKCAFILSLPEEDRRDFIRAIQHCETIFQNRGRYKTTVLRIAVAQGGTRFKSTVDWDLYTYCLTG